MLLVVVGTRKAALQDDGDRGVRMLVHLQMQSSGKAHGRDAPAWKVDRPDRCGAGGHRYLVSLTHRIVPPALRRSKLPDLFKTLTRRTSTLDATKPSNAVGARIDAYSPDPRSARPGRDHGCCALGGSRREPAEHRHGRRLVSLRGLHPDAVRILRGCAQRWLRERLGP